MVFVDDSLKDFKRSKGFCNSIAVSIMFLFKDFRNLGFEGLVLHELSVVVKNVITQ
jgi:hypothetical protein